MTATTISDMRVWIDGEWTWDLKWRGLCMVMNLNRLKLYINYSRRLIYFKIEMN
jgi:hypothetical protein